MQIRTIALTSLFIFSGFSVYAQQTETDTIKSTKLEEVVVTGQIEPQSVKKSVFNVRVISRADIQRQAANNLADVLNQYLNISITPSSTTGRSTVSMFGLDSNYLKVLVDNVPLVSDTGLGNNIDLTQINLDDVERVEIIEGAMGVTHGANAVSGIINIITTYSISTMGYTHGANAVSGIINIITRKNAAHDWEINTTLQEETIGDEYALATDKGRHIQSIRVAHNIGENWFAAIGANRNDFQGFKDKRGGRDYTDYDPLDLDHQRGYSWLPKEQVFTNAMLRYQKGATRLFYKFEYFNEDIDFYDPVVSRDLIGSNILLWSQDRKYNTQKIYNHLNAVGKIFNKLDYNISGSYQKQQRNVDIFKYYIQTGEKQTQNNEKYQETEVIYSTGTLSNFFKNKTADLQIGYEAVNTNGYSSSLAGTFNNDNQQGENLKKRIENYDVFAASEIKVNQRFSVRPGFRYSFQSKFDDQWAASMGVRQLYDNGFEARASYGRSYRTPNYDELYTYMVDANHNIQGNPNLLPETGNSFEINFKKVTSFDSGIALTNALSSSYIDVNDRIEQAVVATVPTLQYKYINIDKYKMWNITSTHSIVYNNLEAKAGVVLMGISRKVDTGIAVSDDKFLFTYQFNANVAYTVPQWNTVFSAFYKVNGQQQQFVSNGQLANEQFNLQKIETFGLLDVSARKSFFNRKLDATIGARNLLNVVNVRSNIASGATAHTAGTTDFLMGYGRSYFLKLTYNLNF